MADEWVTVEKKQRGGRPKTAESESHPQQQQQSSGSYWASGFSSKKQPQTNSGATKKYNAGTNKQKKPQFDPRQYDDETLETFKHEMVSRQLATAVQQARSAKGMTQKDLAAKISEKITVINEIEGGRCIYNPVMIQRIERVLGAKLRHKQQAPAQVSAPDE